ncbi:MAG TPA: hypothetical protein VGB72_05400 [Acidobacteriota bacterium]
MKVNKGSAALSLLSAVLGVLAFLDLAAGQEQKEILLFTFIPQDSALFSEADIQMTFPQPWPAPSRPGLDLPPLKGSQARGRNSRPPSSLAIMEDTLFTASLVSFVALNIADYVATRKVLQQVGPEGVNPIFRPFTKNDYAYAVFKLGYTLMSCISIKSLHDTDKPMAWALSLISNFLVSYALAYNLEQLENSR